MHYQVSMFEATHMRTTHSSFGAIPNRYLCLVFKHRNVLLIFFLSFFFSFFLFISNWSPDEDALRRMWFSTYSTESGKSTGYEMERLAASHQVVQTTVSSGFFFFLIFFFLVFFLDTKTSYGMFFWCIYHHIFYFIFSLDNTNTLKPSEETKSMLS